MPSERPNILFLFADQHRHDWIGSIPDVSVRTPNINNLADRGIRLTNAITPSPLCAPARACLAAGVEYPRAPVTYNGEDFPTDQPTLYRQLRNEAGYHVTGCRKFDLHKNTYEWGVDGYSFKSNRRSTVTSRAYSTDEHIGMILLGALGEEVRRLG